MVLRISKLVFLISLALFLVCPDIMAQKFGYVDTKFVLDQMKEYKQAQGELTSLSDKWRQEIDAMFKEVEDMENAYRREEILLTEDMRKERQQAIAKKRKEARDKQNKTFGFEGLFFLKKQELVKPVQDKVFDAVEKVAKKKKLQVMFDKSGDMVMLYSNPVHDYTDYVLEELGLGDKSDTPDNKR